MERDPDSLDMGEIEITSGEVELGGGATDDTVVEVISMPTNRNVPSDVIASPEPPFVISREDTIVLLDDEPDEIDGIGEILSLENDVSILKEERLLHYLEQHAVPAMRRLEAGGPTDTVVSDSKDKTLAQTLLRMVLARHKNSIEQAVAHDELFELAETLTSRLPDLPVHLVKVINVIEWNKSQLVEEVLDSSPDESTAEDDGVPFAELVETKPSEPSAPSAPPPPLAAPKAGTESLSSPGKVTGEIRRRIYRVAATIGGAAAVIVLAGVFDVFDSPNSGRKPTGQTPTAPAPTAPAPIAQRPSEPPQRVVRRPIEPQKPAELPFSNPALRAVSLPAEK